MVDLLCKAPVFGWMISWCGNIQGAGATNMSKLMSEGQNIALIPGGFEEATLFKYYPRAYQSIYPFLKK